MRRWAWALLAGVGVAAPASAVAAGASAPTPAASPPARSPAAVVPRTQIRVRPGVGGPRTTFVAAFRVPERTGTIDGVRTQDVVTVFGSHHAGCGWAAGGAAPAAPAGGVVSVRLPAAAAGGRWCAGWFHGSVTQSRTIVCPTWHLCPLLVIAPQTIGTFRFRVR